MFTWAIVFIVIAVILFLVDIIIAEGDSDRDLFYFLFLVGCVSLIAGSVILHYASLGHPANGYDSIENNIVYKVEKISEPKDGKINIVLSKPNKEWRMFGVKQEKATDMEIGKYYFTTGGDPDSWKFEPFVQKELTNR